jgi:hypothetical protein
VIGEFGCLPKNSTNPTPAAHASISQSAAHATRPEDEGISRLSIADCQLPIANCRLKDEAIADSFLPIGNRQLAIGNPHPKSA